MITYISRKKYLDTLTKVQEENIEVIKPGTRSISELLNLDKVKIIGIDTETTGLDPLEDKLLLITLGNETNQVVINARDEKNDIYHEEISRICLNPSILKIIHNIKFDYKFLKYNGIITDIKRVVDTYLMESFLTNGLYRLGENTRLDAMIKKYLGIDMDKTERKSFEGLKNNINKDQLIYAAKDVIYLPELYKRVATKVIKYELTELIKLECEAAMFYGDMELNGIYLDQTKWSNMISKYQTYKDIVKELMDEFLYTHFQNDKKIITKDIQQNLFGNTPEYAVLINYNSHHDMKYILEDKLNLCVKTEKETESTSEEILSKYTGIEITNKSNIAKIIEETKADLTSEISEIFCRYLLLYRVINKILTTYGEDFLENISPITGRIHPSFLQTGTLTGRVSCKKPNLQNIPATGEFRHAFTSVNGKILTADYSGAELRIMADLCNDKTMLDAFNNNEDVHSKMATIMNGIEVSKHVNSHLRSRQKAINFGLAYGAGAEKFKVLFNNDLEETKKVLKKFFTSFPDINKGLKALGEYATTNKNSRTLPPFNRIRWYPELFLLEKGTVSFKEKLITKAKVGREGKNHPIQGTSADIIKLASIMIRRAIIDNNWGDFVIPVNQVHDELVFEIITLNDTELEKTIVNKIVELMEEAGKASIKKVKMEVEFTLSNYWEK